MPVTATAAAAACTTTATTTTASATVTTGIQATATTTTTTTATTPTAPTATTATPANPHLLLHEIRGWSSSLGGGVVGINATLAVPAKSFRPIETRILLTLRSRAFRPIVRVLAPVAVSAGSFGPVEARFFLAHTRHHGTSFDTKLNVDSFSVHHVQFTRAVVVDHPLRFVSRHKRGKPKSLVAPRQIVFDQKERIQTTKRFAVASDFLFPRIAVYPSQKQFAGRRFVVVVFLAVVVSWTLPANHGGIGTAAPSSTTPTSSSPTPAWCRGPPTTGTAHGTAVTTRMR